MGRNDYEASPHKGAKSIKERKCLGCGETFDSTGPGNRLCLECSKRTSKSSTKIGSSGRKHLGES